MLTNMSKKTQLAPEEIIAFLQKRLVREVNTLYQLVEGEESQTFSYKLNSKEYVIRINKDIKGFQKDDYAYNHFHSARIPIPEVVQLGHIDGPHAFCLTEKMPGITLQDVDSSALKQLLQPTTNVWLALADCDLSHTGGFGDFDAWGQGTYETWQQFLRSVLNPHLYDWKNVLPSQNQKMFESISTTFSSLIAHCPEERSLIHGDFGANNMLTNGQHITAVLDWANAKYGDPLFDVATTFFWSPWLACMSMQATHFEPYLSTLPYSRSRVTCYQLYIGLAEIYDSALHHNWKMFHWALARSIEIVQSFLTYK